jgi:hypothetical protein
MRRCECWPRRVSRPAVCFNRGGRHAGPIRPVPIAGPAAVVIGAAPEQFVARLPARPDGRSLVPAARAVGSLRPTATVRRPGLMSPASRVGALPSAGTFGLPGFIQGGPVRSRPPAPLGRRGAGPALPLLPPALGRPIGITPAGPVRFLPPAAVVSQQVLMTQADRAGSLRPAAVSRYGVKPPAGPARLLPPAATVSQQVLKTPAGPVRFLPPAATVSRWGVKASGRRVWSRPPAAAISRQDLLTTADPAGPLHLAFRRHRHIAPARPVRSRPAADAVSQPGLLPTADPAGPLPLAFRRHSHIAPGRSLRPLLPFSTVRQLGFIGPADPATSVPPAPTVRRPGLMIPGGAARSLPPVGRRGPGGRLAGVAHEVPERVGVRVVGRLAARFGDFAARSLARRSHPGPWSDVTLQVRPQRRGPRLRPR